MAHCYTASSNHVCQNRPLVHVPQNRPLVHSLIKANGYKKSPVISDGAFCGAGCKKRIEHFPVHSARLNEPLLLCFRAQVAYALCLAFCCRD